MKRVIPVPRTVGPGLVLNLGAGNHHIEGAIPLDLPEWDGDTDDLPYEDNSVDGIYAHHVLEHFVDPARMLRECERVLRPDCILQVCVPYYLGTMAFEDLDHKKFFTLGTWEKLLNNSYYAKHGAWRLRVHTSVVMAVKDGNLALITQFEKIL